MVELSKEVQLMPPLSPFLFRWLRYSLALAIFLVSIFPIFPSEVQPAQVIARWNSNPEPGIIGYKVYYGGTSRNYQYYLDAGNSTNCTLSNLEDGKTYYFAVTAYNASGHESPFSNEMTYNSGTMYSISPAGESFGAAGGEGKINIRTQAGFIWTATSNTSWLIISSGNKGIGDGTIQYSVPANPDHATRTGALTIAGKKFTVTQTRALPAENKIVFAVNCGGPQYADKAGIIYQADSFFSGGGIFKTPASIMGTEDPTLYQSERFGNFSYNIPVANGNYAVILKFAEIYNSASGQRIFDVKIEGKEVVSDLDLYSRVGKNRAYDLIVPVSVADGVLNIEFRTEKGNAKVNAILVSSSQPASQFFVNAAATAGGTINPQGTIKVASGSTQTFSITANTGYRVSDVKVDGGSKGPSNSYTFGNVTGNHTIEAIFQPGSKPVFAVNCGGNQYVDKAGVLYQADSLFSGGGTYKTTAGIAGTDDGLLYQSERFGNISYNFPLPNGNYEVTLKFAEIYPYASLRNRIFDVKMEGKEVVSNLDLVAKVGKNKAYDVTLPVTVTDGILNIEFRADAGSAKVNAILVVKK